MEQGVIVLVPDTMAAEDEGNRTHFIFLHLPVAVCPPDLATTLLLLNVSSAWGKWHWMGFIERYNPDKSLYFPLAHCSVKDGTRAWLNGVCRGRVTQSDTN